MWALLSFLFFCSFDRCGVPMSEEQNDRGPWGRMPKETTKEHFNGFHTGRICLDKYVSIVIQVSLGGLEFNEQ